MSDDTPKLNVAKPVPYTEQMAEKHAAQEGMSRQEVIEQFEAEGATVEDMEELVERGRSLQHNWVDRGLKLSCEDAGHPNHQVWKPRKRY